MPELILAIDVGTTSLGVGVYAPAGDLVAFASAPVRTHSPAPGRGEQDVAAIWRAARRTISRALQSAGRTPADLAAIGVTSQRTSAVVWERASGRPLSPLVLWSDLRGTARALALGELGFPLAPQQAAAKLEALVGAAGPGRLAWGNIDAYLIWRLTGVSATDRSQAWPTGYLDLTTMGWNRSLLDAQGLDEALFPQLVDTWGPIGVTRRSALGVEAPVTADVADQQSALIAHGGEAGCAKVTYGTSATLNLATGRELVFRSLATPPFVQSAVGGDVRFCLEGMVISAGAALDWLRATLRMGDHKRFDGLAAAAPDAGGVWFLPALQGLGAPHPDATRRGAVGGLSAATTASHIARAALEGVAFRVREVVGHVFALAEMPLPEALGVDGGLSASDALMQIQADILGRPVRRHALHEATAAGAAICAGRGAGLITDADARAFVRYERTFTPAISADEADTRFSAWRAAVYGTADNR